MGLWMPEIPADDMSRGCYLGTQLLNFLAPDNVQETVDFTFNKSWDVSGQKNADIHHHEIEIPANATPGNYHMMVYCTDAAGNEAHIARNIVLSTEGGDDHDH